MIAPLLAPRFLSPVLPDLRFQDIIFTSETGVAAFRQLSAEWRGVAWCVGDRTADAARASGYLARSAEGDADALITVLKAELAHGPLLHARGREATGNLANRLNSANIETFEAVVYAQETLPMSMEAEQLFAASTPIVAPIFSPRSGQLLAAEQSVIGRRASLWVAALSYATAIALEPARPEQVTVANRPDAEAMLAALAELIVTEARP